MTIVACAIVCNEMEWLPVSLESIYPFVDRIILVEGAIKGWHFFSHSIDGTLKYLSDFKDDNDPDDKLEVVLNPANGHWSDMEAMKNEWFRHVKDGDWIIHFDADEVYHEKELPGVVSKIRNASHETEFVPLFLHFFDTPFAIVKPHPLDCNIIHQRIFRYQEGYHYRPGEHPCAYDKEDRNTFFHPDYQAHRVFLPDTYVYHYGWAKSDWKERATKLKYCFRQMPYLGRRGGENWTAGKLTDRFRKKYKRAVKDKAFQKRLLLYFRGEDENRASLLHPSKIRDSQWWYNFHPSYPLEPWRPREADIWTTIPEYDRKAYPTFPTIYQSWVTDREIPGFGVFDDEM